VNRVIKLLVVDDHALFRRGLIGLLAEMPEFVVIGEASNGQEALTLLEKVRPDILLLDINMPGMSGLELLDRIKQKIHTPPPVVMMITAYGDSENFKRAMELGADDFLTKPVDFIKLKEKIKTLEV